MSHKARDLFCQMQGAELKATGWGRWRTKRGGKGWALVGQGQRQLVCSPATPSHVLPPEGDHILCFPGWVSHFLQDAASATPLCFSPHLFAAAAPRNRAAWALASASPLMTGKWDDRGETDASDWSQYCYYGRKFHLHIVSKQFVVIRRGTACTSLARRWVETTGSSAVLWQHKNTRVICISATPFRHHGLRYESSAWTLFQSHN